MVKRHEFLKKLSSLVEEDEIVINAVGGVHHEWESIHPSDGNLYLSGMGFVAPVALGLALSLPKRRIISMEGDGSMLMGIGVLSTIGWKRPSNLIIMVFDNGCYEAPGGLSSATAESTDIAEIARAAGIQNSKKTSTLDEFGDAVKFAMSNDGPHLIVAIMEPGTLKVQPRSIDGLEAKYQFVRYIERTEGRPILTGPTLPPQLKNVIEEQDASN